VPVIFYSCERKPINRNDFNSFVWKPALAAVCIIAPLKPGGGRKWEESRDNVHRVPNAGAKLRAALRNIYEQSA
jgi:hypothetical protein